ncbi:MAG: C4-dicarboxylate ABC transporter substrate-binding protein, partial [Crocosphaera sp.]
LTWAIVSNFRQYSPFYPELASQQDAKLLSEGLIYLHPGAQQVFNEGDPRVAWQRYLQENKPLQAAFIMLVSTSSIGFLLRWWRKKRQKNLLKANRQTINELRQLLDNSPQKAREEIENLRQKYRLMLIDGTVTQEVYEQIEKMTQIFSEQCQRLQDKQRESSLDKILILMNEWSKEIPDDLILEHQQLKHSHHKYQEMLQAGQLDLQTYLQMIQLTLAWTNLLSLNDSTKNENKISNESE